MKLYQIITDYRKGGSDVSKLYQTKEAAIRALKDKVGEENDEFGGNIEAGTYYSTESSYQVVELDVE